MNARTEQKCDELSAVVHGGFQVMPVDGGFGSIVQYTCDLGYMLIGQSERHCQGDRNWSGYAPTCETDGTLLISALYESIYCTLIRTELH